MIRNFSIRSSVDLDFNGKLFDLHNDFDFVCFIFSIESNEIIFRWRSLRELNKGVELRFIGISRLYSTQLDVEVPRVEDRRLSFIGFLHSEDESTMDGFLPEDMSDPSYHLILKFEGGMAVKIFADEAGFSTYCSESLVGDSCAN